MNYRIEKREWKGHINIPMLVHQDGRSWPLFIHPGDGERFAICTNDLLALCQRDMDARIAVQEYSASIHDPFQGRGMVVGNYFIQADAYNADWEVLLNEPIRWEPVRELGEEA